MSELGKRERGGVIGGKEKEGETEGKEREREVQERGGRIEVVLLIRVSIYCSGEKDNLLQQASTHVVEMLRGFIYCTE